MWSGLSACAMSAAPSMATPTVATEPATASSANVGFLEAPPDLRDEENALRVPVRVALTIRVNMLAKQSVASKRVDDDRKCGCQKMFSGPEKRPLRRA